VQITDDTFLLYAAKHYINPGCRGLDEFHEDLKRFKYLKRLINKYIVRGELNERLILNHLILLHNVFEHHLVPMLFFKMDRQYWGVLKAFLVFLNYLPDHYRIDPDTVESDIPLDIGAIHRLRRV
jgi:hypothetical protein